MKASQNTLESLADIQAVKTTGDIRRIGAQMLLALARKEISAGDLAAAAKMIDAQANHLNAEVKTARTAMEMRVSGASLVKIAQLGRLEIGTPEADA